MELIFDVETSDKIAKGVDYMSPLMPWVAQVGAVLSDHERVWSSASLLIRADGRAIEDGAFQAHGLTTGMCDTAGVSERAATILLFSMVQQADRIVCHNTAFDIPCLLAMLVRNAGGNAPKLVERIQQTPSYCTMKSSMRLLDLPGRCKWCPNCKRRHDPGPACPHCGTRHEPKFPSLEELTQFLFGESVQNAHDAMADVMATRRCYYRLVELGHITPERETAIG